MDITHNNDIVSEANLASNINTLVVQLGFNVTEVNVISDRVIVIHIKNNNSNSYTKHTEADTYYEWIDRIPDHYKNTFNVAHKVINEIQWI